MPLQRTRLLPVARAGLSFNGVDQYAEIPHSESLNPAGDGFSIVFSLLLRERIGTRAILTKRTSTDNGYFVLTSEGTLFWDFGGSPAYRWNTGYVVPLNTWQHIALVQRSDGRYLYVNASLVASTADKGNSVLAATTTPLRIACDTLSLRYFNNMVASSFLIYSRALTDEEVLWNFYYPDNPVRSGLVLWLHWDSIDTASNMWYDKSGFGNHATLYNNPVKEDVVLPPKRVLSPTRTLAPVR